MEAFTKTKHSLSKTTVQFLGVWEFGYQNKNAFFRDTKGSLQDINIWHHGMSVGFLKTWSRFYFFESQPADFWEWKQLEIALNFLCKYHWLQRQISLSPLCLVLSLSALSVPFPSRWLLLFDIKLMRFPFSRHILAVPGLKEDSIYVYTLDDICFEYLHKTHPPYLYVFQMPMYYSCTSPSFFPTLCHINCLEEWCVLLLYWTYNFVWSLFGWELIWLNTKTQNQTAITIDSSSTEFT